MWAEIQATAHAYGEPSSSFALLVRSTSRLESHKAKATLPCNGLKCSQPEFLPVIPSCLRVHDDGDMLDDESGRNMRNRILRSKDYLEKSEAIRKLQG